MLVQSSFLLLGVARIYQIQLEEWSKEVRRTAREWRKCMYRLEPSVLSTEVHLRHLLRKNAPTSSFTFPQQGISTLQYEPAFHVSSSLPRTELVPAPVQSPPEMPVVRTDHVDTSVVSVATPIAQTELDLLLEGNMDLNEISCNTINFAQDSTLSRMELAGQPIPELNKTDSEYRMLCQARHGPKRRRICPKDHRIGYTEEEWEQLGRNTMSRPAWYSPSFANIPDYIHCLCMCRSHSGALSSYRLETLWNVSVKKHIDTLAGHFQQYTLKCKNDWASRQFPSRMPTHDLGPILEADDLVPPSPEVGRGIESSQGEDANALFPWSHLSEARIEGSTPLTRSDARPNDSVSSILQGGAWPLPSPEISHNLLDLRR